jgi:hypothetical protein
MKNGTLDTSLFKHLILSGLGQEPSNIGAYRDYSSEGVLSVTAIGDSPSAKTWNEWPWSVGLQGDKRD